MAELGLRLPVAGAPYRDYFVGAYFDQLPSFGQRLDWACLEKTYDGHRGIDILLPHFPAMDAGVPVLSAAPGEVTAVHDGEADRNTQRGREPEAYGNHVVVDHGTMEATYAHLRRSSLRVEPGEVVRAGDTLGLIGSSGDSNWPHLHFEVRKFITLPVAPHAGPCSPTRPSLWQAQLPYQDSFVVLDAGTTDREGLSWADILERPETVDAFGPEDGAVGAWLILYNPPSAPVRFELLDPDGGIAGRIDGAVGSSFSTSILQARFPIEGLSGGPGEWRIHYRQAGRLEWEGSFRLEVPGSAAAAAPARSTDGGPRAAAPSLLVWSAPAEGPAPRPTTAAAPR